MTTGESGRNPNSTRLADHKNKLESFRKPFTKEDRHVQDMRINQLEQRVFALSIIVSMLVDETGKFEKIKALLDIEKPIDGFESESLIVAQTIVRRHRNLKKHGE